VSGLTQLGEVVYVVCSGSPIIKAFTDTLSPLSDIHVQGMKYPNDIVASVDDGHLYVADDLTRIWRVSVYDHRLVRSVSPKIISRFD